MDAFSERRNAQRLNQLTISLEVFCPFERIAGVLRHYLDEGFNIEFADENLSFYYSSKAPIDRNLGVSLEARHAFLKKPKAVVFVTLDSGQRFEVTVFHRLKTSRFPTNVFTNGIYNFQNGTFNGRNLCGLLEESIKTTDFSFSEVMRSSGNAPVSYSRPLFIYRIAGLDRNGLVIEGPDITNPTHDLFIDRIYTIDGNEFPILTDRPFTEISTPAPVVTAVQAESSKPLKTSVRLFLVGDYGSVEFFVGQTTRYPGGTYILPNASVLLFLLAAHIERGGARPNSVKITEYSDIGEIHIEVPVMLVNSYYHIDGGVYNELYGLISSSNVLSDLPSFLAYDDDAVVCKMHGKRYRIQAVSHAQSCFAMSLAYLLTMQTIGLSFYHFLKALEFLVAQGILEGHNTPYGYILAGTFSKGNVKTGVSKTGLLGAYNITSRDFVPGGDPYRVLTDAPDGLYLLGIDPEVRNVSLGVPDHWVVAEKTSTTLRLVYDPLVSSGFSPGEDLTRFFVGSDSILRMLTCEVGHVA